MNALTITRREALAGLAASTALPFIGTPAFAQTSADAQASALLDSIAENLLRESPEGATSLGIDKGDRAWMRSKLSDRSGIGQQRLAQVLRADLARGTSRRAPYQPYTAATVAKKRADLVWLEQREAEYRAGVAAMNRTSSRSTRRSIPRLRRAARGACRR